MSALCVARPRPNAISPDAYPDVGPNTLTAIHRATPSANLPSPSPDDAGQYEADEAVSFPPNRPPGKPIKPPPVPIELNVEAATHALLRMGGQPVWCFVPPASPEVPAEPPQFAYSGHIVSVEEITRRQLAERRGLPEVWLNQGGRGPNDPIFILEIGKIESKHGTGAPVSRQGYSPVNKGMEPSEARRFAIVDPLEQSVVMYPHGAVTIEARRGGARELEYVVSPNKVFSDGGLNPIPPGDRYWAKGREDRPDFGFYSMYDARERVSLTAFSWSEPPAVPDISRWWRAEKVDSFAGGVARWIGSLNFHDIEHYCLAFRIAAGITELLPQKYQSAFLEVLKLHVTAQIYGKTDLPPLTPETKAALLRMPREWNFDPESRSGNANAWGALKLAEVIGCLFRAVERSTAYQPAAEKNAALAAAQERIGYHTAQLATLYRDGVPFAWRTNTAIKVSQEAFETRDPEAGVSQVLWDALLDAGCSDDVLGDLLKNQKLINPRDPLVEAVVLGRATVRDPRREKVVDLY